MSSRARITFGCFNVVAAALVVGGVFGALPVRWWVVDSGAIAIATAFVVSGAALLTNANEAPAITRACAGTVLAFGLALVAALCMSVSFLAAVYGALGKAGVAIFVLAIALVAPYVVVLPAIELFWIGPRER